MATNTSLIDNEADDEDWLSQLKIVENSINEPTYFKDMELVENELDGMKEEQSQFFEESATEPSPPSSPYFVTHDYHELIDPKPDIKNLFIEFDKLFFYSRLGNLPVEWSNRMTSSAGITVYIPESGFCRIRLSNRILPLRLRKDLVETLLHEMIHAFLFIVEDNRDHDDHGPQFISHMNRINELAMCNIGVFHTFIDEVKSLKKHWWRCNGRCRYRAPFYGYVKMAVNRAPGPSYFWWGYHLKYCNGEFIKIREP